MISQVFFMTNTKPANNEMNHGNYNRTPVCLAIQSLLDSYNKLVGISWATSYYYSLLKKFREKGSDLTKVTEQTAI